MPDTVRAIAPQALVDELKLIAVIPDPHIGAVHGITEDGVLYGWAVNRDNTVDWEQYSEAAWLCPTVSKLMTLLGLHHVHDHLEVEPECHTQCITGEVWANPTLATSDLTQSTDPISLTPLGEVEGALDIAYQTYCRQQRLPEVDAEELIHMDTLTDEQRSTISRFIQLYNAIGVV